VLLLILTGASNRSKHVLREVERAAHCQNHLLTSGSNRFPQVTISPTSSEPISGSTGSGPLPPSQHFPALAQHTRKLLQNSAAEQEPEEQSDTAPEIFAHFRILRHADGSLFKQRSCAHLAFSCKEHAPSCSGHALRYPGFIGLRMFDCLLTDSSAGPTRLFGSLRFELSETFVRILCEPRRNDPP
jgi:hypothetical protein